MRLISTLLSIVIPVFCFSQTQFVPGFIVRNGGDTIRGYVNQEPFENLQNNIEFKHNIFDTASKVLTVNDIKAFGFNEGDAFQKISYSNPIDNSWNVHFAQLMLKGYYQLFSFVKADKIYFLAQTAEDSTYLLYDAEYTSMGGIKEESSYKNLIFFLARNCFSLKKRIENLSYNKTDILNYIHSLNECLAPSSANNIVYKKEKSKMDIYVYTGGIAFEDRHEITARAIARFTIPSFDKKTSLNIGFNYMNQVKTDTVRVYPGYKVNQVGKVEIYSIPLSFQYNFTRGIIQPYIDAGLSFDYKKVSGVYDYYSGNAMPNKKMGIGFTAAAGIEGRIAKNFMFKADWRYELLLHYPTIGIAYIFR